MEAESMKRKPNVVVRTADGVAHVDVSTPKFPDAVALVDVADVQKLLDSPRRWYACQTSKASHIVYVMRNVGREQKSELLHRVLLGLEGDVLGDHKNGDGLDNRRDNLRSANGTQNSRNCRRHANSSSRYLGVSWCERDKIWRAYKQADGKKRALGSYQTEEAAARAYDAAATDDFDNLNFP